MPMNRHKKPRNFVLLFLVCLFAVVIFGLPYEVLGESSGGEPPKNGAGAGDGDGDSGPRDDDPNNSNGGGPNTEEGPSGGNGGGNGSGSGSGPGDGSEGGDSNTEDGPSGDGEDGSKEGSGGEFPPFEPHIYIIKNLTQIASRAGSGGDHFDGFQRLGHGFNMLTAASTNGAIVDMSRTEGTVMFRGREFLRPIALSKVDEMNSVCSIVFSSQAYSSADSYTSYRSSYKGASLQATAEYENQTVRLLKGLFAKIRGQDAPKSPNNFGFSASKSKESASVSARDTSTDASFFETSLSCEVGTASIIGTGLPLTKDFIRALRSLPNHYIRDVSSSSTLYSHVGAASKSPDVEPNLDIFTRFFENFGTHYYSQVTFGASVEDLVTAASCTFASAGLSETTVSACIQSELNVQYSDYSGGVVASYCSTTVTGQNQTEAIQSISRLGTTKISGGDPRLASKLKFPLPKQGSPTAPTTALTSFEAWLDSAVESPAIINHSSLPIPSLVAHLGTLRAQALLDREICPICATYPDIDYSRVSKALDKAMSDYLATESAFLAKRPCKSACNCEGSPDGCTCGCVGKGKSPEDSAICCKMRSNVKAGATFIMTGMEMSSGERKDPTNSVAWRMRIGKYPLPSGSNQELRAPKYEYSASTYTLSVVIASDDYVKMWGRELGTPDHSYGDWNGGGVNFIENLLMTGIRDVTDPCDDSNRWYFEVGATKGRYSWEGKVFVKIICPVKGIVGLRCDECAPVSCFPGLEATLNPVIDYSFLEEDTAGLTLADVAPKPSLANNNFTFLVLLAFIALVTFLTV